MNWFVLAIAIVMYGFVIVFPHRKSWFTLGAAFILLGAFLIVPGDPSREVGIVEAFTELVNWNVLMIYVGSLLIAELFIYSRAPARFADEIVDRSPNVGIAIVAILVMTGLISAFVENVATVLVMAPIALALSDKLKMKPTYFMVGLAVMANLQGTATLVGDPPSMIFASFAHYNFNDFFFYQGKPSIFFAVQVGMLVGAIYFYFYFSKTKTASFELAKETVKSWVPTVLLVLMILGLAAVSFMNSGKQGKAGVTLESGLIVMILAVIGYLWYRLIRKESRQNGFEVIKGLDWDTILFLIGIFIVIGAMTKVGLIDDFAHFLTGVVGGNVLLGFTVIVGVSVLISGFVDNVPYIIAMLPVAAILTQNLGIPKELYMFGLLIGSCLGGNLTPFGASANVVAVGLVKKQGIQMSFMDWLKIGLPFTVITTVAASAFVWFVW